jgi:sigma-B regulation protein RsbU (phosphoserine phosphatase)
MISTAASPDTVTIESLRENELQEARAIQRAMLASEGLQTAHVNIESEFQPFSEVGGDFLDYFLLSDGTAGLYLGDVTGKGLPAALFAALAVGTLRGVHKTGTAPSTVLAQLNKRMMLKSVSLRYAAVQYAHLDPKTGVMQIASAGMHGPLHLRENGCDELTLSGIPPGLFPHSEYEMKRIQLAPGDSVVFLSDGLTDAMNAQGEILGLERVTEMLRGHEKKSPQEILQSLFGGVEEHSHGQAQQDDRTAAVLRYLPG